MHDYILDSDIRIIVGIILVYDSRTRLVVFIRISSVINISPYTENIYIIIVRLGCQKIPSANLENFI